MMSKLNTVRETTGFLEALGIEVSHIHYGLRYVRNMQVLLNEMNIKGSRKIMANERGVATAMIAALLAQAFGVRSERVQKIIGLAALLHDTRCDLSQFSELDPAVIIAVRQARQRQKGTPMSAEDSAQGIGRLSEIVSISSEFVGLILLAKSEAQVNPILAMKEKVFEQFSFPVVQNFQALFVDRSI